MPPKRRKVGRPKGSRNKKKLVLKSDGLKAYAEIKEEFCDYCEASFKNKYGLMKHRLKCKVIIGSTSVSVKKAVYSCDMCSKRFTLEESYKKHLSQEHSTLLNSVQCKYCIVKCPDKETLQQHINKFHEREIFKCEHCDKEFVRRAHVLRHLAQKGCGGQKVLAYPCEICSASFSRKDNLMAHLRVQHILKGFLCKQCTYHTRNFSKLILHTMKMHTSNPQFECDICGKVTGSRGAMVKHLEIHGEKKYSCDVKEADECIDSLKQIRSQIEEVAFLLSQSENNQTIQTMQCGYTTFTIEVMRRHVFTHIAEKPYKCSICNRSYIQRMQLEKHLEKHAGFECKLCSKTFDDKPSLLAHKREHFGKGKSLICPYDKCKYSVKEEANENDLNLHIKSHETKNYKCEVCTKTFSSEMNIRRHLTTHSLDRPRRCMYCVRARAFVRGEQLVKHVRKAHPDVFRGHLGHVRVVLGVDVNIERVSKNELECVLNVLDAEAERIMQGCGGGAGEGARGVLYGGIQLVPAEQQTQPQKSESPLMSEEELVENLTKLLAQLIDHSTLQCFGWPGETVDLVLEKVIEQCGAKVADRERFTRVQRLRENAKHLFLYVVEDKNMNLMLSTHTIDQVIKHILEKVTEDEVPVENAIDNACVENEVDEVHMENEVDEEPVENEADVENEIDEVPIEHEVDERLYTQTNLKIAVNGNSNQLNYEDGDEFIQIVEIDTNEMETNIDERKDLIRLYSDI